VAGPVQLILVSLKSADEEGSAIVACHGIQPDPLLPDNVVLENVVGLSWPFQGKWVNVSMWSVRKDAINHWMVGPIQDVPSLTPDMLDGGEFPIPHPPDTTPAKELVNDASEIETLIRQAQALIEKGKLAPVGDSPIPDGK
jgi:hypothetical protein